jgi:uncharacterized membrane protein
VTEASNRSDRRLSKYVPHRLRVAVAGVAGIVAYALAAILAPWQVALLIGWDVMAAGLLVWVWMTFRGLGSEETARLARTPNPPFSRLADLVVLSASVASLAGVAFALVEASKSSGGTRALITGLAVLTVALSWLSVHVVYALRYGDLYYEGDEGINFHGDRAPDYGDFAYVAFTIGMTYQVSDFELVSRPMRMLALRHSLVSYVFGVAVIALTINVVAGLVR